MLNSSVCRSHPYNRTWKPIDVDTLRRFIGLVIYMGVVKAPNVERYWSTKPLYHGLWSRRFMTKLRFKQIMCFLKLCNPNIQVAPENKLHKVELLYKFVKARCKALYQPGQNICVDERMVANKGRYNFRQYMKDKPVKWGMKIWVLACSLTGYSWDFIFILERQMWPSRHMVSDMMLS